MPKTVIELQKMLKDRREFYSQRNINFTAWRDFYFMNPRSIFINNDSEYIEPEIDERRVVLPTCLNLVEAYRELLLAKSPSISVPQASSAADSLIDAEHNELTLLALWERAGITDRLRDCAWHALVDGWGVMQVLWDKDNEECPIRVLHHDPYNVYPMPNEWGDGWKDVIHAYPRLWGSVKDEWPKSTDSRSKAHRVAKKAIEMADAAGLSDTDYVTYFDYWDDTDNGVGVSFNHRKGSKAEENIAVWLKEPQPHGYGFLGWYIFLPFRLPFKNVGHRMGVSLIYPIQEIKREKDILLSSKATMLARYQDPPLVTKTEMGEDFEPVRTESGLHLRLKTDEAAEYLVHPGTPQEMDTLAAQLDESIEAAGLPKALQGIYAGEMSGVAMNMLRNPTLMKVAFKQKEFEKTLERMNADMLKLIENKLKKPILLWGTQGNNKSFEVNVDPTKIRKYYRNSVKLSATLPSDDANTVNMLMSLIQGKVLSAKTVRDVAQQALHDLVPQSLINEERTILAEAAMADPNFLQPLAMKMAQLLNLPYLQPQAENPKGGHGDKEITMPAQTIASQTPGMPGGNTEPDMQQRLAEMMSGAQQAGQQPPMPMPGGMNGR